MRPRECGAAQRMAARDGDGDGQQRNKRSDKLKVMAHGYGWDSLKFFSTHRAKKTGEARGL